MKFIHIKDKQNHELTCLYIESDNIILRQDYFYRMFPHATAIRFYDNESKVFGGYVYKKIHIGFCLAWRKG